jgi:hypothetical protein
MKKLFISILIIACFAAKSFAQQTEADFTSGITKLFNWIVNIDEVITSINEKEKLKKMHRLLGNISFDISNIYDEKTLLAIAISKKETLTDQTVVAEINKQITQIQDDITELLSNLRQIKGLVNQTNQNQVDSIIREVEAGLRYKKLQYMKDIRDYLFKKNISYNQILNEANLSKQVAADIKQKITAARDKLFAILSD